MKLGRGSGAILDMLPVKATVGVVATGMFLRGLICPGGRCGRFPLGITWEYGQLLLDRRTGIFPHMRLDQISRIDFDRVLKCCRTCA